MLQLVIDDFKNFNYKQLLFSMPFNLVKTRLKQYIFSPCRLGCCKLISLPSGGRVGNHPRPHYAQQIMIVSAECFLLYFYLFGNTRK